MNSEFNISTDIEARLNSHTQRVLRRVGEVCEQRGVQAVLVGGTIRDLILGLRPLDIDISISSDDDSITDDIAASIGGAVVSRSQFGTSKITADDLDIDVAMMRSETYDHPGALPTVSLGSLEDDLARRDFSINAIAAYIVPNRWGEIVDPQDGRRDIENRSIRVLHSKSFVDDATRIFRAIRYATRLGFDIEAETRGLLSEGLGYIDTIKGDRVRNELQRMLDEDKADRMFEAAKETGVLEAVFQSLSIASDAIESIKRESSPDSLGLYFAALLAHSVTHGLEQGLIQRLNLDSKMIRSVRDTASIRDLIPSLSGISLTNSELHQMLREFDENALYTASYVIEDRIVTERIQLYLSELRYVKPILNGDDLIGLGVPQGPQVGTLLEEILSAKLNGELGDRASEEHYVRNYASPPC